MSMASEALGEIMERRSKVQRARRVDHVLCAMWMALAIVAALSGWHLLLLGFFAFAAGERWGVSWYRS